jgi:hypothetical protein
MKHTTTKKPEPTTHCRVVELGRDWASPAVIATHINEVEAAGGKLISTYAVPIGSIVAIYGVFRVPG